MLSCCLAAQLLQVRCQHFLQACRELKIVPYSNSAQLIAFICKINQWKIAIYFPVIKEDYLAKMRLFDVEQEGLSCKVKHYTTENFESLNLGYFDRIDRHQVVVEVACFVLPFFFTTDKAITGDKRHHFYLTQMLLTVKGGVEFAIILIAALEDAFEEGWDLEAVLMQLFSHLQSQLISSIFKGFAHLQRMRRLREVYVGAPFEFSMEDEMLDWQRINNVQNMWKGPFCDARRKPLKNYIPGFSATEMRVFKDWSYPTRVNVVPVPLDFGSKKMKRYYGHFLESPKLQELYGEVTNEVKLIWVDLTYEKIMADEPA